MKNLLRIFLYVMLCFSQIYVFGAGANITWDENGIYFTTPSNAENTIIINDKSFGETAVDAIDDLRRWPVFLLPVPAGYYDIELKASTNDFKSLVYYTSTTGATTNQWNQSINNYTTDSGREVFYFDDIRCGDISGTRTADRRAWVRHSKAWSIYTDIIARNARKNEGTQAASLIADEKIRYIMICPNFDQTKNEPEKWMYESNDKLSWVYLAFSAIGHEKGPDGNVDKWNLCAPIRWNKKMYNPTLQRDRKIYGDIGLYIDVLLTNQGVVKALAGEVVDESDIIVK